MGKAPGGTDTSQQPSSTSGLPGGLTGLGTTDQPSSIHATVQPTTGQATAFATDMGTSGSAIAHPSGAKGGRTVSLAINGVGAILVLVGLAAAADALTPTYNLASGIELVVTGLALLGIGVWSKKDPAQAGIAAFVAFAGTKAFGALLNPGSASTGMMLAIGVTAILAYALREGLRLHKAAGLEVAWGRPTLVGLGVVALCLGAANSAASMLGEEPGTVAGVEETPNEAATSAPLPQRDPKLNATSTAQTAEETPKNDEAAAADADPLESIGSDTGLTAKSLPDDEETPTNESTNVSEIDDGPLDLPAKVDDDTTLKEEVAPPPAKVKPKATPKKAKAKSAVKAKKKPVAKKGKVKGTAKSKFKSKGKASGKKKTAKKTKKKKTPTP